MNDLNEFEKQINDKLAAHQNRLAQQKDHVAERMMLVDQRHQVYTALADRIAQQIIMPRLKKLVSSFDNAEILPPEQAGRHQGVCVFRHTTRFPATARLELGLSRDGQAQMVLLLYRLQIIPLFFDFKGQDEKWIPVADIADDQVTAWFEEKIAAFLDNYLLIETIEQYQADNMVTDPVCGMRVHKLHAAAEMQYQGQTYFFCVPECLEKFKADPARFLTTAKRSK